MTSTCKALPSISQSNPKTDTSTSSNANVGESDIGLEKAQQIALQDHPNGSIKQADTDYENGKLIYEIEVVDDQIEFDYTIDGLTGEILHTTQESIYD